MSPLQITLSSGGRDVPTVVIVFCLHVKVSPSRSLFAASQNLATSQPGHGVVECWHMAPEGLASDSHWKRWTWGAGFLHENFRPSHQHLPPEKVKVQSSLACPSLLVAYF